MSDEYVTCFFCRQPIAGPEQWRQAVRLSQGTVHGECAARIREECDRQYVKAIEEGRHPRPEWLGERSR